MKVIKLISFLEINTLALLIVPSLADSLPYFSKDMDLCLAYSMEEGTMESIQIKYLNLINLMYAFKNVRNMENFLEENASPMTYGTHSSRTSSSCTSSSSPTLKVLHSQPQR